MTKFKKNKKDRAKIKRRLQSSQKEDDRSHTIFLFYERVQFIITYIYIYIYIEYKFILNIVRFISNLFMIYEDWKRKIYIKDGNDLQN